MGCTVWTSNISKLLNVNGCFKLYVRDSSGTNGSRRKRIINAITRDGDLHGVRFLRLDCRARRLYLALAISCVARVTTNRFTVLCFRLINVRVICAMLLLRMLPRMNGPSQGGDCLMAMFLRGVR